MPQDATEATVYQKAMRESAKFANKRTSLKAISEKFDKQSVAKATSADKLPATIRTRGQKDSLIRYADNFKNSIE